MVRPTSKAQFETVYLRTNAIKKILAKLPADVVRKTLSDPQFKKCTRFIARNTFNKNQYNLLEHGFGYEDVESITELYGLSFLGCNFTGATDKDRAYLMMRYINQRWEYFFIALSRKFDLTAHRSQSILPLDALPQQIHDKITVASEPQLDDSPTIEDLEDEMKFFDFKISILRDMSTGALPQDKRAILDHKYMVIADRRYVEDQVRDMRKQQRRATQDRQDTTAQLKNKLLQEGAKHANALCYHATSRHVGAEVRRKAREYCRKMKLDYVGWAHQRISDKDLDDKDFVL